MIFKELKLYFKKYKVITVMIYLQVTLILLLLGSFLYFMDSLKYEENGLKETYEGKALYQLIDNYVNEDEEILMNSDNSLEIVKNYYNNLNSSKNFQYLNINNQAIGLINHNIDDIFKYGYELGQIPETDNNNITPIKSIQINRQAFDFFKIDVSDGVSFSQDDFKFNDNFIPVILGNSYKDIYKIGDILPIEYYLTKFNAKVIGFAKSDSKVLLNRNMEEYLDRYMIIPQIDFDNPTNKTEYEFQKIVYLVRSNGYICVNNTAEDIQNMMLDIKLISEKTGFDKYLFIGYNPHLNQYNNLLSIIKENQNLIKTILSLITIFSIFILILVILLQNKRRHSYFAIHYMQGSTLSQIILQQYLEIFIIFILAYITYFIILNNIFFIGNSKIHIILFLFIIFLNLILTVFSVKQIVANSIYKFLAVNETEEN